MRHAIPPARHERKAIARHKVREQFGVYVPIADVVIAGVIQPAFFHLPDDLADIGRVKPRVQRRVGEVHVPLVEDRLGLERGIFREQPFGVSDCIANPFRTAAIDVPRNKMQREFVGVACIK